MMTRDKKVEIYNASLDAVYEVMGVGREQILLRSRLNHIKEARHMASCLMVMCGLSLTETGYILGRNHTTILNSKYWVSGNLQYDKETIINFIKCVVKVSHLLEVEPTLYFLSSLEKGIVRMDTSPAYHVREFCRTIRQMLGTIIQEDTAAYDTTKETLMHNAESAIDSMEEKSKDTERGYLRRLEERLLKI